MLATASMTATIVSVLALLVAAYGAVLATRTQRWQRSLEERRRRSQVEILAGEELGLDRDGPLVVGETVALRHALVIKIINKGEAPEYVHGITLEPARPSPVRAVVRRPEGTVEVRPRDQETFCLTLDGSQAFPWNEPFHVCVQLADNQVFRSAAGEIRNPPQHGQAVEIPDLDAVPDEEIGTLRGIEGSDVAKYEPPAGDDDIKA